MERAIIQKEIELPTKVRGNHRSFGVVIDLISTITALKPGDSFVVDEPRSRDYALIIGGRKGIPITTQKEESRFRVWRKK